MRSALCLQSTVGSDAMSHANLSKAKGLRPPGHLALFEAIKHGRFRQAQLLVEGGADVNGRHGNGDTCLISTCTQLEDARIRARFARLLLDAGADVNAKDGNGQTGLIHAAILGCLQLVDIFLHRDGIDVNAQDTRGNSALMYAALFGHEEMVKTMLDSNKFQLDLHNFSGSMAADLARSRGHSRLELALRVYDQKKGLKDESKMAGPLNELKKQEFQIHPPNRPPTPAHLHLLPNLDLNASVRSEPDTSRNLRLSNSALLRINSEPFGLDQTYEQIVDLSRDKIQTNATEDVRLPPILPTRTVRKSLKRKKNGSNHVPLIDAK